MVNNPKAPYTILYEDDTLLAVYKKREVFSTPTEDKATLNHNLSQYLNWYLAKKHEQAYLVHRLDYETSGVMVFAKSLALKRRLQSCFEQRSVLRYYEAVIAEAIPLGVDETVIQYLDDSTPRVRVVDEKTGKEAITHIRSVNRIQIGTALALQIETGRHNQIRLALQSRGYTLLGDKRFAHNEAKRMYLNAYKLVFPKEANLSQSEFATAPLWITGE